MSSLSITNEAIKEIFDDEIEFRAGEIKGEFDSKELLLLRGLLPQVDEVAPQDLLRNGIALRAQEDQISVHSFIERKICRNGMILRMDIGYKIVDRYANEANWAEYQIREAIDACANPKTFSGNVVSIGQAMSRPINRETLNMMRFLGTNVPSMSGSIVDQVNRQLLDEQRTEFGLMNAITAVARDTFDQKMRWNLEELGGRIGLGLVTLPERPDSSEFRARMQQAFSR